MMVLWVSLCFVRGLGRASAVIPICWCARRLWWPQEFLVVVFQFDYSGLFEMMKDLMSRGY